MAEQQVLEIIVKSEVNGEFLPWFLDFFKDNGNKNLTLEGFAEFFLSFLRNQTDRFIKVKIASSVSKTESSCNTPQHSSIKAETNESQNISGTVKASDTLLTLNKKFDIESEYSSFQDDLGNTLKSTPTTKHSKVQQKNFTESQKCNNGSKIQSKINFEVKSSSSSTKNVLTTKSNRQSDTKNLSLSDTSKSNKSFKSPGRQSLCLGDFLTLSPSPRQRQKPASVDPKNSSNFSSVNATNTTSKSSTPTITSKSKPKKRVALTTVASSCTTTCDNFMQKIKNEIPESFEAESDNIKSSIEVVNMQESEKKISSTQKNIQSSVLENKIISSNSSEIIEKEYVEQNIDLSKIDNKNILDRLIEIHSTLIDLQLTTNILSEMSYLFNLIHADADKGIKGKSSDDILSIESFAEDDEKTKSIDVEAKIETITEPTNNESLINESNDDLHTVLKKLSNCIYFAVGVLKKQKHLLALMDVTTLKIILDSERLDHLAKDLKTFLFNIYSHKIKLESKNSNHEVSFKIGCNFTNVSYQQENDTKNNFPSSKEFNTFNKQRDMFYSILRNWEENHLHHTWDGPRILGPKIRELFSHMEHPINMAHLAKLFTAQLIMSSNFPETTNESEMGLLGLNVNPKKLNKLCQRLVAPNNFSTDYHFPGKELFFKEFISMTNSIVFLEQLKITLIAELIELNDSSYEIINLQFKSKNGKEYKEYVVRPETISIMRTLAKFLGLVITRPFTYEDSKNILVNNRQIELRNMVKPSFDVMKYLKIAIVEKKLIITLPWVVQYLFMLDHITLQLDYYRELARLLYELYMNLNSNSNCTENTVSELLQMRPTSVFILRLCLGWLFEHHFQMSENYFDYRRAKNSILKLNNDKAIDTNTTDKTIEITDAFFNTLIIDEKYSAKNKTDTKKGSDIPLSYYSFDLILEEILYVACPFLADFRMSIMTNISLKCRSRTGRYVTTKISPESIESPISTAVQNNEKNVQEKLIEAFLHSQSLSMRRIIEFVIERTTSAVIKDFQMEILIPSKSKAKEEILKINSKKMEEIISERRSIFTKTHKNVMEMWSEKIPQMIENRVKKSLEGLLPNETMSIVRETCASLIIVKCKAKTENWKQSNLNNLDFYSKNIVGEAEKFFKTNFLVETENQSSANNKQNSNTTNLIVDITKERPSVLFDELQNWLHFTSMRPEFVNEIALEKFCIDFLKCLQAQILPTSIYKLSASMTIALVQNLIKSHENVLTSNLLNKFIDIWLCDKIIDFMKISINHNIPLKDHQESPLDEEKNISKDVTETSLFDSFITNVFIRSIQNKPASFDCLSQLLISVIDVNLLTIDYLNEKFVALFKEEWSETVLKQLSGVLDSICKRNLCNNSENDAKSQLFMEMLAGFTRDLDDF